MHEESVRVPMLIHWGKFRRKGGQSDALVSSVDVLPAILDLTGLNTPDYLQGFLLSPILLNGSVQVRDYIVSERVGVGGKFGTSPDDKNKKMEIHFVRGQ
jgi:arylsulfatase A-like enzyme